VQRLGDGAEDHAAGLRDALAQALDRALAGPLGLVEAAEREQRLDLDDDAHGEQVRVRLADGSEQLDGVTGVGVAVLGAPLAQADLGSRHMEDGGGEAVAGRQRRGGRQAGGDLPLGPLEVALLHREVGEVVARHRLFPRIAGLDGQRQHLLQSLRPVVDAEVAEHHARVAASEDAQLQIAGAVGELDRLQGVLERLGVGAGEEVELRLDGRELGAYGVALGERARLGRQDHGAVEVAALEHDGRLENEPAAAQRVVAARAGAHSLVEGRLMVLVVVAARGVQRPVLLAHTSVLGAAGRELEPNPRVGARKPSCCPLARRAAQSSGPCSASSPSSSSSWRPPRRHTPTR
jgi:hypothetical protein